MRVPARAPPKGRVPVNPCVNGSGKMQKVQERRAESGKSAENNRDITGAQTGAEQGPNRKSRVIPGRRSEAEASPESSKPRAAITGFRALGLLRRPRPGMTRI